MRAEFVNELYEVTISDGVVTCRWASGNALCMPLRLFRQQHARNGIALAEYEARLAPVVPIRHPVH